MASSSSVKSYETTIDELERELQQSAPSLDTIREGIDELERRWGSISVLMRAAAKQQEPVEPFVDLLERARIAISEGIDKLGPGRVVTR